MGAGMDPPAPPRTARDPDAAVLALGAAVLAGIVAIDVALKDTVTLAPWVLIAPMYIATRGTVRETTIVAIAAFLVSIGLGGVNDTFGDAMHVSHMALVAAGGALAVFGAGVRRRLAAERERTAELLDRERAERVRQEFASRASQLLEAPPDEVSMLDEVAGLAVPDMADLCLIDLMGPNGTLAGVVARSSDPHDAEAVRAMRSHAPIDPAGEHPVAVAARTGRAELLAELQETELRRYAADAEHLEMMMRLNYRSAIVVPLGARGRTIGVLSLLRFAGETPYDDQDLSVARDLARRAALAIDNARLFGDLQAAESQLETILTNLTQAVTVQDASGELVFANQAAADIMGASSPEDLLATPVAEIAARYWQFTEDGSPFPPDAYPGRRALTGERPEPVVLRQVDRATHEERWVRLNATPIESEGPSGRLAVTVTEDITDVVHIARRQRFLASATKLLASSLDVEATIEKVAWAVVPDFADWCAVHVPDEHGRLRQMAVADLDVPDPARFEALADSLFARTPPGESNLDDVTLNSGSPAEVASVAVVPLVFPGDEKRGAITLVTAGRDRRLSLADLALMEEIGRRAGVAIANARVHAARSYIATTLQRSLLPPRLPDVPGLTLAARFRAAGVSAEVGGDFYDLFPAVNGWMVAIGDVTGKGPVAAAITSLARYTLRTAALYERRPERALERLNDVLLADPERRQLCTAVCAHLSHADDAVHVRLVCAGHPPPYVLRDGDGAAPTGRPGTLLGAFEEVGWEADELDLRPGDTLVLYTDGVTDTTRGDGERFGQDRLGALLNTCVGLVPEEIARRVDAALLAFEEGAQRDDLAILVLRADAVSR
jgi:PAS domain S-box-containing protein